MKLKSLKRFHSENKEKEILNYTKTDALGGSVGGDTGYITGVCTGNGADCQDWYFNEYGMQMFKVGEQQIWCY